MAVAVTQMTLREIRVRRDIPVWLRSEGMSVIAEVGVRNGDHLHSLLKAQPSKLVAVDLWRHVSDLGRNDAHFSPEQIERCHQAVQRLAERNPCIEMRRGLSTEVAAGFPDQTFDFVYLDADHTYDGVRADIAAWWPKVRPGGVLGGHDYILRHRPDGLSFGIVPAVHEFLGQCELREQFHCTWPQEQPGNWFIRKPAATGA